MSFTLTSGAFSGPIGLLVQLVGAQKLDLFTFSLTTLVDDYLKAIAEMEQAHLEISTEFLTVAATLIAMKARKLLPIDEDENSDDDWIGADQHELVLIRLIEAAMFRGVGELLSDLMVDTAQSAPRNVGPDPNHLALLADPLEGVSPERLRDLYGQIIARQEVEEVDASHITVAPISTQVVGERFFSSLESLGSTSFFDATRFAESRYEIVVCFVVMLEAYRAGLIDISGEDGVVLTVVGSPGELRHRVSQVVGEL